MFVVQVTPWRTEYYNESNQLHREDGPATIDEVSQCWYEHGELHRIDGPAMIVGQISLVGWFIKGHFYGNNSRFDYKSFQRAAGLTEEDMLALVLKYCDPDVEFFEMKD